MGRRIPRTLIGMVLSALLVTRSIHIFVNVAEYQKNGVSRTSVVTIKLMDNTTQSHGSNETREESTKEHTTSHNTTAETMHHVVVNNCTAPLFAVHDTVHKNEAHQTATGVPRSIHVTSISRCMTTPYTENLNKWRFTNHSLLIHDDNDVNKLFASTERWSRYFPKLSEAVLCLPRNGSSSASKADVWRYLILWDEGGLYTDMDNAPGPSFAQGMASLDPKEDDALIPINKKGRPNQSFLVMTPKHPLMYIVLSIAIERLLNLENLAQQNPFAVTGPSVLLSAFEIFTGRNHTSRDDHVIAGFYTITPALAKHLAQQFPKESWMTNRTLHVVGSARDADAFVRSSVIRGEKKLLYYKLTGMSAWQHISLAHEFTGSCRDWIHRLKNTTTTVHEDRTKRSAVV